jgi:signal transduction histidine kinase
VVLATSRDDRLRRYPDLAQSGASLLETTMAVVPLLEDTTALGALMVTFDDQRVLDAAEQDFLVLLGRHAAQALRRARQFEAARAAEQAARDALRARDEFLGIASHELRTPVTAIKSLAQLLQRTRRRGMLDMARLDRSLAQIATSSDRLATLTEDLLDVSRLQSGRFELHLELVDVAEVVYECADSTRPQLEARHELTLRVDESCQARLDRVRFEQVMGNLLSNALKYSPVGGEVGIEIRRSASGVLVSVRDQGIGLPPGQAELVFQPFGRASNASQRQIQGMGLGLYICRHIVERHGGRIWAESEGLDRGATFTMWLPCADG